MQQQPQQQKHRHYYQQRLHGDPVAYEEKTRVINFAPEDEPGFVTPRNGAVQRGQPWKLGRQSERHSAVGMASPSNFDVTDNDDDGRQRSRVKTRPVVGTRASDLAAMYQHRQIQYHHHQAIHTRPSSAVHSVSNYTASGGPAYFDNQLYQDHRPLGQQAPQQQQQPPPLAVVQSPVAKRVAAGKQRNQKEKQQQPQQQQQQQQQPTEGQWVHPRASSESSFGGRLFFGWRRTQYEAAVGKQPNNGVATPADMEKPSQYRGKNLHNFSYTDAKIYSPQSYYQQKELQQEKQRQKLQHREQQKQQKHRANIWWTMETMGAVNSVHSNQMMLARGAPEAVKVQGDYC